MVAIAPDNVTVLAIEKIRTDGGTQPRINQDWKIIGEYAQDMLEGAIFPPVIAYFDEENYWLADGFHRYHAAKQITRETIEAEIRHGSRRDAVLFSVGVNAHHGFRRTNEDKRAVVEKLLRDEEWSKWSNREIARHCAVDESTVRRYRENLSAAFPQIGIERLVERNGSVYPMNTANIGYGFSGLYSRSQDERASSYTIPVEKDEAKEQPVFPCVEIPESWKLPPEMRDEARRNTDGVPLAVPHIISKNNEWYTPSKYIEAARRLMEEITLDPASCEEANRTVRATTYYDIDTNGLAHDWHGKVWLNPPYGFTDGRSNQDIWSNRLIDQYANGNIDEAVLLVNAAVDTNWFHRLFDYPVCLTRGRINFTTPETTVSGSTHGSAFVYFGSHPGKFSEIFCEFGTVVKRW